LDKIRTRPGINLSDFDTGRTNHIANPAATAVIDRIIWTNLTRLSEATCLGSFILWPWKEIGYGGHRTGCCADIAFNALVEGHFYGVL
jgi:hypothetical protein